MKGYVKKNPYNPRHYRPGIGNAAVPRRERCAPCLVRLACKDSVPASCIGIERGCDSGTRRSHPHLRTNLLLHHLSAWHLPGCHLMDSFQTEEESFQFFSRKEMDSLSCAGIVHHCFCGWSQFICGTLGSL